MCRKENEKEFEYVDIPKSNPHSMLSLLRSFSLYCLLSFLLSFLPSSSYPFSSSLPYSLPSFLHLGIYFIATTDWGILRRFLWASASWTYFRIFSNGTGTRYLWTAWCWCRRFARKYGISPISVIFFIQFIYMMIIFLISIILFIFTVPFISCFMASSLIN